MLFRISEMDEDWATRRWFTEESIAQAAAPTKPTAPAPAYEGTAEEHARRILGGSGQQRRERGRKCVHVRSSRFLEARSAFGFFGPRRFFEARCTFGGVVPRGIVLAFGRFVSCGVLFVIAFGVGLVWQLAYGETYVSNGNAAGKVPMKPALIGSSVELPLF